MAGRIKDREDREVYSAPWIGGSERSEPITRMLVMPYDTESESRNADFLWTSPFGLEGSGAFRRPGSIVRVLRTERWVRPTERAGSEGSFICRCLGQRKPSNRASLRGPPIGGQDRDGASYRCSAPYTLSRFAGLPLKGKRENMREKTASHILHVPFRRFPPLVAGATTFPPQAVAL